MAIVGVNEKELTVVLGASPNDSDAAVTSIDEWGSPGILNQLVLKEYGYPPSFLPGAKDLDRGFFILRQPSKKPVLFIVTVTKEAETVEALRKNLLVGLMQLADSFEGNLWVPLMGTGDGGLDFLTSYQITQQVLKAVSIETRGKLTFVITINASPAGKQFFQEVINLPSRQAEQTINLLEQIKSLSTGFYAVGSFWSGDDQTRRFLEENSWENGHDENFTDDVSIVKEGDILILKSTYAHPTTNISYLRVKGVGIVTDNPGTGYKLSVDWRLKNIQVDVAHLGYIRRAFTELSIEEVETIFTTIGIEKIEAAALFQPIVRPPKVASPAAIASLIADLDSGDDYLGIKHDVQAFSKLIASKAFQPPLAIALFGEWGSGKSFFMRKLQAEVQRLSLLTKGEVFCKGISHIHFNAWSYMDANLWASIVTKIFEGLNEYINKDTKARGFKHEIEKQLTEKLTITKQEVAVLESQKKEVEDKVADLTVRQQNLQTELEAKIQKIGSATLSDIIKTANEEFSVDKQLQTALHTNESLKKTKEDIKELIPVEYWDDPAAAYKEARSVHTFLRQFFAKNAWKENLLWLSLILSIIIIIPWLTQLVAEKLEFTNVAVPQVLLPALAAIIPVWKTIKKTYQELQPIVATFWNIKEAHEKAVKDAIFQHEQHEKALKIEIEQGRSEITNISQHIQQANTELTELQFKISNALATEALYAFIEKRCSSEDYKKYLGIISTIRKDFETLSELFNEQVREAEAVAFREKFKNPLQRIVLYIDDLDRCPEERVVEVLQAVNLLMAFPLFIVIVGVDPRWVKNALSIKYKIQFGKKDKETDQLIEIEVANYLEKIFQVPFHLRQAEDAAVKNMIRTLAMPVADVATAETLRLARSAGQGNDAQDNIPHDGGSEPGHEGEYNQQGTTTANSVALSEELEPARLQLTGREIELLEQFSVMVGNNPRAIKRFVNVYHIVRAHEGLQYKIEHEEKELTVIMFLLALPIGPFRKLSNLFMSFINHPDNLVKNMGHFLNSTYKMIEANKRDLKRSLEVALNSTEIADILQNAEASTFLHHNTFIKRFTFEDDYE
jgi:hypothetical protein